MSRPDPLAAHIRRLGNHDLNELLVQLSKPTFAALVEVALARPILPAGLLLRYELAPGVDGWTVVACAPRRRLGTLTRDRDPNGHLVWRAWTRAGDPVQVAGVWCWRRRGDAAAALAWVTPASRARFAGPGRPCPRPGRPRAARAAAVAALGGVRRAAGGRLRRRGDGGMTAVKRCPRCGQVKPAGDVLPAPADPAVVLLPVLPAGRRPGGPPPAPPGPGRRRGAAGGRPDPSAPPPPPGRPGPERW